MNNLVVIWDLQTNNLPEQKFKVFYNNIGVIICFQNPVNLAKKEVISILKVLQYFIIIVHKCSSVAFLQNIKMWCDYDIMITWTLPWSCPISDCTPPCCRWRRWESHRHLLSSGTWGRCTSCPRSPEPEHWGYTLLFWTQLHLTLRAFVLWFCGYRRHFKRPLSRDK